MDMNELLAAFNENSEAVQEAIAGVHGQNAELRQMIEDLEVKAARPGFSEAHDSRESREHVKLFNDWLRRPQDDSRKVALSNLQADLQAKDVTIGSGPGGGFAVPAELVRQIENLEKKRSPVRRIVKVIRTSTGAPKLTVNLRGATGGWAGETDARSATDTPLLREVAPTFGELYAYLKASEWSLDDMFFDVGAWLTDEVAQTFAEKEGIAVISGNGTKQPTGMLNTTPTATEDFSSPLRDKEAYEYIASVVGDSPPSAGVTADALITLVYSLNSIYRANARWVMNSTTAGVIRKLKNSNGDYVWAQGIAAGQPDRLLGYPVEFWEDLPDITANAFPVAFGDFSRGYVLCDRSEIKITLDDNITEPGFVKYYVRRREGGIVYNNDAIKWLQTTVS